MPTKRKTTRTRTTRRRRIRGGRVEPAPPGGPSANDRGLGLVIDNSPPPFIQPSDAFLASVMQGPAPSGNIFQRAWSGLKNARLISRGLRAVGLRGLANRAEIAGLGMRKRRTTRRRK